jgi:dihydroorotate dehydrogenase electron transfer subunit
LIAAGDSPARILPLATGSSDTASAKVEVALYSCAPLPRLPTHLEAYPLEDLSEALEWADFLAIDAPADGLGELRERLALPGNHTPLPPGQVLIHASMPCAGLGDCGVCAVKTRRGWKLACKEGPVFDLKEVIT